MFKKSLAFALLISMFLTSVAYAYVGNRNTRKFHHDRCHSVYQMADRNKVYINSRQEAINAGYIPCQRCRP